MDKIEVTKCAEDLDAVQWPLMGYAPGHYMRTCLDCKATMTHCDKRATQCLSCAIAAIRLATRTDATPVDWMPIESVPKDKYVLLQFDGPFDDKESPGVAVGKVYELGVWLTAIWAGTTPHKPPHGWAPIPANHIEEPRAMVPATDVAALVEAAKRCIQIVERHNHRQNEKVEDVKLILSAALAPFTKGKNDE